MARRHSRNTYIKPVAETVPTASNFSSKESKEISCSYVCTKLCHIHICTYVHTCRTYSQAGEHFPSPVLGRQVTGESFDVLYKVGCVVGYILCSSHKVFFGNGVGGSLRGSLARIAQHASVFRNDSGCS